MQGMLSFLDFTDIRDKLRAGSGFSVILHFCSFLFLIFKCFLYNSSYQMKPLFQVFVILLSIFLSI